MRVLPLVLLLLPCACRGPGTEGPTSAAVLGQEAPDVELGWLDGSEVSGLGDLRGRVVLLEFWRTWCNPCLRQVPRLNALHERYAEDGLAIVGVTSEEEEVVRATVEEAQIAYPVALTRGEAAEQAYGITAVPRAFLVDRRGDLVWVGHPGTLEEGRLRELLYQR